MQTQVTATSYEFVCYHDSLSDIHTEVQIDDMNRRNGIHFEYRMIDGVQIPIKLCTYVNDMLHGSFVEFNENGFAIRVRHYHMDVLHGIDQGYYENGQTSYIRTFNMGVENGTNIKFWPNGNTKEVYDVMNGVKEGQFFTCYLSGRLNFKTSFKNDIFDGDFITYDVNGEMKEHVVYKYGVIARIITQCTFNDDNDLSDEDEEWISSVVDMSD